MVKFFPSFNARLAKQLTAWVFLSLVVAEAIILLPSYLRRKQALLEHQDDLVAMSVEAAFLNLNTATPDRFNVSLASTVFKYLQTQSTILGGAVVVDNSYLASQQGDYPDIPVDAVPAMVGQYVFDRQANTYDTAISVIHAEHVVYVLVRYDGRIIHRELYAYALRIIVLVLVIAAVVTATTMVGVDRLVIRPILALQGNLPLTKAIQSGEGASRFPLDTVQYDNELDSIAHRFQELYHQIWQTMDERESALLSRQREKERADQLKTTLEELHRTQSQLVQAERIASLHQLTAGMAHEINNPITFIQGNIPQMEQYLDSLCQLLDQYQQELPPGSPQLQALEEECDLEFLRSDYPKIVSSLQRGTHRIQEIVSSLQQFARIDERGLKQVWLESELRNTLELLRPQLMATSQRPEIIIVETYGGVGEVECYPALLNQVFLSILTNAIEAINRFEGKWRSEKDPTIWIETQKFDSQWVDILLRNNGPYLSATEQQRLFDPFYTTKSLGEGTGLSLFSCYQVIQHQHHGILSCASEPGEDVTFQIRLLVSLDMVADGNGVRHQEEQTAEHLVHAHEADEYGRQTYESNAYMAESSSQLSPAS